jgi:hypothetical protein
MIARTIPRETERRRPKKGQEMHNLKGPKRGREPVSLVVEAISPMAPLMSHTCKS